MRKRRLKRPPKLIQLTRAAVAWEHGLYHMLARDNNKTRHQLRELHGLFAFKSNERRFARELLTYKRHFWLFRCNQHCFCGDFIAVDMSSPQLGNRRVYVIEMKESHGLKTGGGGAGFQFQRSGEAVQYLAANTGAILPDTPYEMLVGNKQRLLNYLGVATAPAEA